MPDITDEGVSASDDEVSIDESPNREEDSGRSDSKVIFSIGLFVADHLTQHHCDGQTQEGGDANCDVSVRLSGLRDAFLVKK